MIDRMIVTLLLGLLSLAYGLECPKQRTSPGREVVCYTSVPDVEELSNAICSCTTLVRREYDVRNLSISEIENFRKSLKEINPALQFVISVDDPGRTIMTSGTVRQEATVKLIGVLKEVDGIELNMTAGSRERLLHFAKGLKDELVRKSYDKRIFLVLPTKAEELAKQFDLKQLSKYVDLFTIPTHYLMEDDEAYHTFHPSRLMGLFDMYNADSLIDLASGLGAPKRKILMSVPASAYRFTLKDQDDNAPSAGTEEMQPVIIDQKQLCGTMSKDEWTIERDEDLTAPYAFVNKTWIAFEDKISVSIKGKYALLRDLPGLAIRDVENDSGTKCGKPLTHEIHHSFTDFKRKSRAAVLNALEDDLHQTQLTYSTKVKSSEFRVVRVVDTEGHIRVVRENTQTEFTCSRQGYFVHPKSCNRFYRCVKFNQEVEDYSVFEFDCPAGLAFDEHTEVCVWPGSLSQGSPCPGSSEIAPVTRVRFECPSKAGYYADSQNPRWFFACIDLGGPQMMAYEFRCPYGLIFDEHKLVCEWPWLVPGYSDSGYTRTEYAGGSGGQFTQGTGGYVTGGLPDGYSGATGQGGVYTGTTVGLGHSIESNAGSGYSGYSGAAGVGYSRSNVGGQGISSNQGSTGYSGATGSGQSGLGSGGYAGSAGSGYPGSTGRENSGVGAGGYTGSVGSGYSGSPGREHSGVGVGGYTGSAGNGYSGSTGREHSGVGAGGYTGSAGSIYSGSTGSEQSGLGSGGYAGSAGSGYPGSTGRENSGVGAGGYSGSPGREHSGVGVGGYTGSAGSGYPGSIGREHSGVGAGGYTGSTGREQSGVGLGGYTGSAGSGYSGSVAGGHVGSGGGSLNAGIGTGGYSGPGATGIKSGSESIGENYGGSTGSGYTGYSGTTSGVYAGSDDTKYSGATAIGSGYSGTGGSRHFGQTTKTDYTGSAHVGGSGSIGSGAGVPGSIPFGHGSGSGYTGSSGVHIGSAGTDYTGPVPGGYIGSTIAPTEAIGTGYAGSIAGGHTGSTIAPAGVIGTSYTGSVPGRYPGSAGGIHGGSTGSGYVGSTGSRSGSHVGVKGPEYSGPSVTPGYSAGGSGSSIKGGYQGSPGVQYPGPSHASGTPGTDYSGTTLSGSAGHGYSVHTSLGGYNQGGLTGSSQTGTVGIHPTQTPTYASSGPIGTGLNSVEIHGKIPGPIHVQKPDGPNVQCGFANCHGGATTLGGGYVNEHGILTDSTFPQQGGVTTTYFDQTGAKDYGQRVAPGVTGYQGGSGYVGGYKTNGGTSDLNITLIGSGGIPQKPLYYGVTAPAIGYGSTGYAGNGAIITGSSIQGSIVTGDSSSGTVIAHGNTPGSIHSGPIDQSTIITGDNHPGYVKTGPSTPGYVISEGVKTIYGPPSPGTIVYGSASTGGVLTGPSQPGTVIKGTPSPGIVLTGQTAHGVSLGGSINQGVVISSTEHPAFGEGGYTHPQRGYTYQSTIGRLPEKNTGYKTNEYYDNGGRGTIKFNNGDVTTKYTENDLPDYRPAGDTIPPDILIPVTPAGDLGFSTPSGFTKTGPTKTGITTATLGGRGSYVISTGRPHPTPNPSRIGEKAFEGNAAGFTVLSTDSPVKGYTGSTSTPCDTSHVDTSRITLSPPETDGYVYPKPSIPFTTGVTTPASIPVSPAEGGIFPATTPTPFLNVEVYKTPAIVTSTRVPPIQYQGSFVSTIRPVVDNIYKTKIESVPSSISHDQFGGNIQSGSVSTQTQFDYGTKIVQQGGYDRKNYVFSTTPSSVYGVPSTHTPLKLRPFTSNIPVPAVTEQPQINYISTSSGFGDFNSAVKGSFGQRVTSVISESFKPQTQYFPGGVTSPAIGVSQRKPFLDITYQQSTPIIPVVSTGGSPTNVEISRDNVGKLVTNYNRGSTKYVPSAYDVYTGGDFTHKQQSSLSPYGQTYSTTPAFDRTQFSGYSRTSTAVYQTTAKSTAVGKPKVIVKWSDLHPLLLGKLGAECTCRGDPFANLRGPGSKLINSSKGKVDLSNYDESEIYVDLEKEDSYEDKGYVTDYEFSSPGPLKIWGKETPISVVSLEESQIKEKPSSTYLPSVTVSTKSGQSSANRGFSANYRSGKSLSAPEAPTSSGESQKASEETIEGATNCARPGLFRHPNFCNKFYACHWDQYKQKFTLHVFNCPVHLTFDNGAAACNWPSMGPACQGNNLLV